ncbi:MAG: sulfatase-like hydrolase/transferase, partial [Pseudonocardia sp.]
MTTLARRIALAIAVLLVATAGQIGYASTQRDFAATADVKRSAPGRAGVPQAGLVTPSTQARAARRPNLVLIMADDMRADDLRFMPSARRLMASKGLRFTNSFSPYPLCCPARSSFMTGQYAHNHHVYSHVEPYGFASFDDRRTIATSLRRAGYRTGFIGKYLNYYGKQDVRRSGR